MLTLSIIKQGFKDRKFKIGEIVEFKNSHNVKLGWIIGIISGFKMDGYSIQQWSEKGFFINEYLVEENNIRKEKLYNRKIKLNKL
jgi:hypothetical protein